MDSRGRVIVDFGEELGLRVEKAAKDLYISRPALVRMAVAEYLKKVEGERPTRKKK
mgnify:CR=1 FL=1